MSTWDVWRQAFDHVTLRKDGDPAEIRGATQHGLDASFANYEAFWRYHIVPATNRPANIEMRNEAAPEISRIGTLSHSLFVDLLNAAESLVKIRAGDAGGDGFRNCTDAIKSDGDAVQKFTNLQTLIQQGLANALGRTITIWSQADWKNMWCPSRNKIIGYRNFLTHNGQPQVMLVPQSDTSCIPYVLRQDYIVPRQFLTWQEQEAIYRTNPEKWEKLATVCEELHSESIKWLNSAYGEMVGSLDRYLGDEDYHHLWGWDTEKHGRHVWRESGAMGAQAPPPGNRLQGGSETGDGGGSIPGSGQGSS